MLSLGMTPYQYNPLELVRSDEAIPILVHVLEGLSQTLALQALHELCELIIWTTAN